MGVASGCGSKEVYKFPYSSCICSFLQQHPYFLFIYINIIFVSPCVGGSKAPLGFYIVLIPARKDYLRARQ